MENIDLSALKKVAEARVAEEEQRAKAHQPHPNGGMTGAAADSAHTAASAAENESTIFRTDTETSHGVSLPTVIELTEANFEAMLKVSDYVPVVVELWADWSQPCKQFTPLLEKLAADYHGQWILATANTEKEVVLAQAFKAQSVPTVVAMAKGRPLDAFAGVQPEAQLRGWLDALLNVVNGRLTPIPADGTIPGLDAFGEFGSTSEDAVPASPSIVDEADALADKGDYAAAEKLLHDYLAHHPGDHAAESALALYQTLARAATTDENTIAKADAHLDDVSAQCDAADREMTEVGAEAAFMRLLNTIARTTGDVRAKARDHLVKLFAMCDSADPLVLAARQQLASLLF